MFSKFITILQICQHFLPPKNCAVMWYRQNNIGCGHMFINVMEYALSELPVNIVYICTSQNDQ